MQSPPSPAGNPELPGASGSPAFAGLSGRDGLLGRKGEVGRPRPKGTPGKPGLLRRWKQCVWNDINEETDYGRVLVRHYLLLYHSEVG